MDTMNVTATTGSQAACRTNQRSGACGLTSQWRVARRWMTSQSVATSAELPSHRIGCHQRMYRASSSSWIATEIINAQNGAHRENNALSVERNTAAIVGEAARALTGFG